MVYLSTGRLQQVEVKLQNYQILFWLCIAGMAVFGIITVVLFFRFHIGGILMELTGIRRKREINKIRKSNGRTGILQVRPGKRRSVSRAAVPGPTEELQTGTEKTVVLQPQESFLLEKELKFVASDRSL
ncbi:MAG: hypothetical protein UFG06_07970 [Lachnospiraceae bacterium]|nr:hypothetical protein [Lachnospiraceae bacterium]